MAYDGYRSPPPPSEQPAFYDYSDPRASQSSHPHHHHPLEDERSRPRGISNAHGNGYNADNARFQQAQQPINEAVTSAFDKADTSSFNLPPEILNQITGQITANVIQRLRSTNLEAQAPANHLPAPSQGSHPAPRPTSPSNHSGSSPPMATRNVYTPPSPQRSSDDAAVVGSPSYNKFPAQFPNHFPSGPRSSPPPEKRAQSPLSQAGEVGEKESRPKGPSRLSTGKGETTLEKIWGQLFDEEGHPTVRLGQFLRGLAVHLIEDYEPRHSLVITPSKMQKYYEDTKLPSELYPWHVVFDDGTSSISRLYREVECEHHLVQERFDERPDIPGLTPLGFERWVTLLIQAHPDLEYERLQKAVLGMPISNPDDKKERFPKEISRRLFPKGQDHQVKDRLERAMETHCKIELRKPSAAEPAPPSHHHHHHAEANLNNTIPASVPPPPPGPPPMSSSIERERAPYSTTPSVPPDASIEFDDGPTPQPIERERKPYVAQPGGGKTYDDGPKPPAAKISRSESMASKTRPIPINVPNQRPPGNDLPIPESTHHREASVINPPPPRTGRNRSPSANATQGDFRRSEGDFFGQGYSGSPPSSLAGDVIEDSRRYRDYREPSIRDDRGYDPRDRGRYQSINDHYVPPRANYANDEDYYRAGGRSQGSGYDYNQQYPPSYR